KNFLETLAARAGLFDRISRLREEAGEGEEPGARGNRTGLPFNLKLPFFAPAGGGASSEQDAAAIGLGGAGKRRSQVGLRPLHDQDDSTFEFRGNGRAALEDMLGSISRSGLRSTSIRTNDY